MASRRKHADVSIPMSSRDESVNSDEEKPQVRELEVWWSSALDVFKGIFILFMLTEHTRSSFSMGMSSKEPIMQFVSQVACALDMTCFSTAYGFSCYRAYLTNSKGRSMRSQFTRLFRSVGLTVAAAWACNISFELAVLQNPPTWTALRRIFTFEVVYWDFLTTFPAMLLTAFITTKPLMAIAARSKLPVVRLAVFTVLLVWPLVAAGWAPETCPSVMDKYMALFVGCVRRSMGAMRFSAFTYMFYFNFGCIASLLTLEFSKAGAVFRPFRQLFRDPVWIAFGVLLLVELFYAIPVFREYSRSWEYLNWNGYRRFPMSAPLILAWGFMSQFVGLVALFMTALLRPRILSVAHQMPSVLSKLLGVKCRVLEHFGANVLLYLTISNFVIHAFFHVDWRQFREVPGKEAHKSIADKTFSNRAWEWIVVAAALGQILFVQLVIYLVNSSRK